MAETYGSSPPKFGRIAKLRGFLPLNEESSPMATHGTGALTNLLRTRSNVSLHTMTRRPSSIAGRDNAEDEEAGEWQNNARRESILNGPQIRSMRLIGNSNPRYRWHQYWKTEEELKKMKKPMYVNLPAFPLRVRVLVYDCAFIPNS